MKMDTLYKLVNPEFELEFNGKKYLVRKATLEQVAAWKARIKELIEAKDPAGDIKSVAYAIALILRAHNVNEEFVMQNAPGDIDVTETLEKLGFMSPKKIAAAKEIQKVLETAHPIAVPSSS